MYLSRFWLCSLSILVFCLLVQRTRLTSPINRNDSLVPGACGKSYTEYWYICKDILSSFEIDRDITAGSGSSAERWVLPRLAKTPSKKIGIGAPSKSSTRTTTTINADET